ncbi:MAG TPA: M28 family peptidase [Anaeromyxobacteraceae bacterium]|nr:M28 family peptidase [Anaeromyxobacteraceae bacterium]
MLPCLALAVALAAGPAAEAPGPRVDALVGAFDAARLQATVARLVAFGTRHTLSDTASETRGIGAARRWLAAEFAAIAKLPGSRLEPFEDRFVQEAGPRLPRAVEIVNVGGVLRGVDAARAREAIVVTGHYDSRASDALDARSDAPGANDDGSGTSIVLELARVLAREKPAISVYLVAVGAEEQGLYGSTHLARRLKAEGVQVVAMTSVDIAGNSDGQDGVHDDRTGRVFSEGVPAVETDEMRKLRVALGAENDGPARAWARYLKREGERHVPHLVLRVMLRRDRMGRGSDHMPFSAEGFPAARLSEMNEHYDRQHQDVRVVDGRRYGDTLEFFDARYAARLGRGLCAAVARLAAAPAPPREVAIGGAVSPDTRLRLALPPDPRIAGLVLYRRGADRVDWERADRLARTELVVLPGIPPDDHAYAIATVDADGNESLPVAPTRLE